MKCQSCGAEIGDSRYCSYCGAQVSAEQRREQEAAAKTGCPKCGSGNIQFRRESVGEVRGKKSKQVLHRTVGLCKDCGFTWAPGGQQQSSKGNLWLWVLGWLFIFPVPLTILMLRNKNLKPAARNGIIAAGWAVYLFIGIVMPAIVYVTQ